MLKDLIKFATKLDKAGLEKYASELDYIINQNIDHLNKMAGFLDKVHIEETPEFAEHEEREAFEEELRQTADVSMFLLEIMGKTLVDDTIYNLTDMLIESDHTPFAEAVLEFAKENKVNLGEKLDSESKDTLKHLFVTKVLTRDDLLETSAKALSLMDKAEE